MKTIGVALLLGVAATAFVALDDTRPALAQPAMALGRPLPDQSLAVGTVTVRVIAGTTSSPAASTSVTLTVNGKPREARTDASGRIAFPDIAPGSLVKASVLDADGKAIETEEFNVPSAGGTRLMLSTKPFVGGGGGAAPPIAAPGGPAAPSAPVPPMSGGGGMPAAREISGQPKPDGTNVPGTYSVRLTYNNLTFGKNGPEDLAPPVGETVNLVGYGADDSIKVLSQKVDAQGNTKFEGLDTTGGTAYFAIAALARGANVDRLIAEPITLGPQAGSRVVLSGLTREATEPGVDDYLKVLRQRVLPTPAGKVRILLDGQAKAGIDVALIDLATMQPIVGGKGTAAADPTQVQPSVDPRPLPGQPGVFEITLKGGPGKALEPLPGATITVFDVASKQPVEGGTGVIGADGTLKLTLAKPQANVVIVLTVNGIEIPSEPFDVTTQGFAFPITAQWPETGAVEVTMNAPVGKLLVAQAQAAGVKYRSRPFMTVAETGATERISVYPRSPLTFEAMAFTEDQFFVVQGQFYVHNFSWAPFRAGPDGLLLELPKGHKGAVVGAQYQNEVAVATGQGFRISRPVPPRGIAFTAGWSQSISDGGVELSMPLPRGAIGSTLRVRQYPGMTVRPGPGLQGQTKKLSTGDDYYVMENIMIPSGQPLVLGVSGLPADATWKRWMPRVLGVTVLLMILGGIGFAIARPARQAPVDTARRDKLLDELVALEKKGIESSKDRTRRDQLIDELESMWGQGP